MKKILNISLITSIFILAALQVCVPSCTNKITTIDINDKAISLQFLTAKQWHLQEYRGVTGCSIEYYLRGGNNNTLNYDLEHIVFNQDNTGTYYDPNGYPSSLRWDFANSENTKLVFTVNFPIPGPTTVTWEEYSL